VEYPEELLAPEPQQEEGVIRSIIFRSETSGYTVLRLRRKDGSELTLTGALPDVSAGEELSAQGAWVTHPSYGDQFAVSTYERRLPADERGILEYLSSGAVRGIGERTARRILSQFGLDTLRILAEEPERLAEIRGISEAKALEMGRSFAEKAALRQLLELLMAYGLPAHLAAGLYAVYGGSAKDALKSNPYLLCDERWDVDFAVADRMARDFGIGETDDRRLCEGILYELVFNMQYGHSFIPKAKLLPATADLLQVDPLFLPGALNLLVEEERVAVESICGEEAVYLAGLYSDETYVARSLKARLDFSAKAALLPRSRAELLLADEGLHFSDKQRQAVLLAAERGLLVLTGGPGTGKTTTVKGILRLFSACGLDVTLAAPTGRAAKRISDLAGAEAKTLHRLLEASYSAAEGVTRFARGEKNPIDADAVIVDEASMIDIRLGAALLRALKPSARLVFVGDPDQLPPVGPGSFLNDLLASGVVPSVRLTEIFRQAAESDIVKNAHLINQGVLPDLSHSGNDFYFMEKTKPEEIVWALTRLVGERIPLRFGIAKEDIQVLSPWRQREAGTVALNRALADALNPPSGDKKEYRSGPALFREDDRVMQIRNNYDLVWHKVDGGEEGTGVFNGDIGRILCIDPDSEQIVVRFDDRMVAYPFSDADELELAYAVTVHKAQGSEFPAVVLALARGVSPLLTRSVLYTAVTRAKQLLVIVGGADTVAAMVKNNRKDRRYSALFRRLAE